MNAEAFGFLNRIKIRTKEEKLPIVGRLLVLDHLLITLTKALKPPMASARMLSMEPLRSKIKAISVRFVFMPPIIVDGVGH